MSKHRRVRVVADTGSTTGAATVVLALLSAGALAGLGLVASTELAPGKPPRVAAGSPDRSVKPPKSVVVGPGQPTAGTPTRGTTPVPGTPTPSPGTVAEPLLAEPLPPILAGPLLPLPEVVVPGVVAPEVPTPSAPVRRPVGAMAHKPGTSVDVAEKAARAKQAKKGKHAKHAKHAKKGKHAKPTTPAATRPTVTLPATANEAAVAATTDKPAAKRVAGARA
jgi:hypothetical protein